MTKVKAAATTGTLIRSAGRAVQILLHISTSDSGLTAKQVAAEMKIPLATAYHLLNTLLDEKVVEKDDAHRFRIGSRASIIADAVNRRNAVPPRLLIALNRVAAVTGETAYLSAWRGAQIVVLGMVEGSQAVRVSGLTADYTEDIHARASGKLLLAFSPEETREAMLSRMSLRSITSTTITDINELRRGLEEVRRQGVAYDRQEFHVGVDCVAAPIRTGKHVVAALTVSSPTERFVRDEADIIQKLLQAAASASKP
jgi:DNA-binding IclR family transcriptional regulator